MPLNMGADFVARSGLGDGLNYVPVNKHTLQSTAFENIFPQLIDGNPMTGSFDGHSNCFIESGDGKALLIDFSYDTEPLTGTCPLPVVRPLALLKNTRRNHLGKLAFRWIYWNVLLPGRLLPLPAHMSVLGKTAGTTHPKEMQPMPVTTFAGRPIQANDEGFLTDSTQWDEDLAQALATAIGITLSDDHWKAIHSLRDYFAEKGKTATLRRVPTQGGILIKQLFALFPQKPATKMAYVAGLPKPHGCV